MHPSSPRHRSVARTALALAVAAVLVVPSAVGAVPGSPAGAARPAPAARPAVALGRTQPARGGERQRRSAPSSRRPELRLPPRLHPRSTGTLDTTAEPTLRAPTAAATVRAPVQATTSTAPAATRFAYKGLASADNNTHHDYCGSEPLCLEPPDPWVAVGPNHVVESVNRVVRIADRAGATLQTWGLAEFFFLDASADTFDARVVYDAKHGRWLAVEAGVDCDGSLFGIGPTGWIDLAVSFGSDPTGEWEVYPIAIPDVALDYPGLGTSGDKVVLSANEFELSAVCGTDGGYYGARRYVFDWDDLLLGSAAFGGEMPFGYEQDPDPTLFTWRPATAVPAATDNTAYGVVEIGDGATEAHVGFGTITGSVTPGPLTMNGVVDLTAGLGLAGLAAPPAPAQPGGTIAEAADERPTDAVVQGRRLAFVSNRPCTPSGDSAARACSRITELTTPTSATGTPSIRQDFLVAAAGADSYLAGVGLAGDGTLHVAWTRSSASAPASTFAAFQRTSDPVNTLGTEVSVAAAAASSYAGTRWGDYVGVAQDPADPSAAWVAGEATAGNGSWATTVAELLTPAAVFTPIAPVRVLDTRYGTGLSGAFNSGTPRSWQVTGIGGIPASAVAITGNVTVVGQTREGFVAVGPSVGYPPDTSTINFPAKDIRANNVTTALSSTGRLSAVFKGPGGSTTQLVFDVTGYFTRSATGATYVPVAPVRLLDTRVGTGLSGAFKSETPRALQVTGRGGIPTSAVAVTGNITVVSQTKQGYLAVTPEATRNVTTSTLNFPVGDIRANGFASRLGTGGKLGIVYKAPSGATTHVVLDVTGYFVNDGSGKRFVPLPPARLLDSRIGVGLGGTFASMSPRTLKVRPRLGVSAVATAITGNLTVVNQTAQGFIAITPTATTTPSTSTLNFPKVDIRANGVYSTLSSSGYLALLYKAPTGNTTHVVMDVTGYFR